MVVDAGTEPGFDESNAPHPKPRRVDQSHVAELAVIAFFVVWVGHKDEREKWQSPRTGPLGQAWRTTSVGIAAASRECVVALRLCPGRISAMAHGLHAVDSRLVIPGPSGRPASVRRLVASPYSATRVSRLSTILSLYLYYVAFWVVVYIYIT